MSRLAHAIEAACNDGRRALMPFLMSGHPTPEAFVDNLRKASQYADVIEIGVPFSDPIADGPVIQAASAMALQYGTTLQSTLDGIVASEIKTPVALMLGVNQVLAAGLDGFCERVRAAGVVGAIIPDLPMSGGVEIEKKLKSVGIDRIRFVAPTTSSQRREQVLRDANGFVYLISVSGTTGTRDTLDASIESYVAEVKAASPVPVCVGFGISKPEHIEKLRDHADGFVVGSAIIRAIDEGRDIGEVLAPLHAACARKESK
ncbi:MAG: tryptophan synthase subunit alpha [Planctomycetota bacterium]|jgi:tryptophan synthase alpha chain